MDEINAGIIRLLELDGRTSNKRIARELGISEATVAARIRALQADRVIRIVAQRNAREDREHAILAIVEFYVDDISAIPALNEAVRGFDEVLSAYETARRPEVCAFVRADSPRALNALIVRMAGELPGVMQLNTLPILDVRRYRTTITNLRHPPQPKPVLDDVGERLIALIEQDGRQSVRALAQQLGLSETAVHNRLHKLLRETSMKIVLVADSEALGYRVWADLRISVKPRFLLEAMDRVAGHPDITIVAHIAGSANLHIFVAARTVEDLDKFIRDHVRTLDGLLDFTIMRVPHVVKYNYNYVL